MAINNLLLLSGGDIPFTGAQVSIHQPTIKDISYIGEDAFFIGCELLNFSKESLTSEDKDHLKDQTNFDILMSIMKDKKNFGFQKSALNALLVLILLFPDYTVQIRKDYIALLKSTTYTETIEGKEVEKKKIEEHAINNKNFAELQKILKQMFVINDRQEAYNPSGDLAKKIADKFKKGQQQRAAQQGQQETISILFRYISILAVGLQKDMNDLMQYTVYQLFDEFQRYQLKTQYDTYLQAKMAGAKDLEEIDYWMKDIHSEKQ